MKHILLTLLLILSFSQLSLGYGNRCHQSHTTLRLKFSSGNEQVLHRNGLRFQLSRLDSSQQSTIAYRQAEHYLNIDFMNSLKRLKKSEDFLKSIQAENQEILQNSYVLLVYDPKNPEVPIGGAVFVMARGPGELLLLAKELKENIFEYTLTPEFPIAEVARVSINSAIALPGTFQNLVGVIMEVIRSTAEIKHFYAYTSAAHQRFYQTLGYGTQTHADQERLPQLQSGDVVIEISR
ncbi:MAG: hypothetical protein ACXWC9_03810 [Pseudobdellovibrionaceae bacterium]